MDEYDFDMVFDRIRATGKGMRQGDWQKTLVDSMKTLPADALSHIVHGVGCHREHGWSRQVVEAARNALHDKVDNIILGENNVLEQEA